MDRACAFFTESQTDCLRCLVYGQPAGDEIRYAIFGSLVGLTGLEPVTLRLSSACSNQLSYRPWSCGRQSFKLTVPEIEILPCAALETRGFEPLTYSLQSYRSTN